MLCFHVDIEHCNALKSVSKVQLIFSLASCCYIHCLPQVPLRLSDLVYAPWTEPEWKAWFGDKRRYPPAQEVKKRSLLGIGGFCRVYRMCNPSSSSATLFAVKTMDTEDLGLDKAQIAEIEREATTLQGLKHKHVIQYIGHFFHDEVEFRLVLEYASGGTLADHVLEEMSSDLQLRLMRELACGLLYIHGQNVLHRDLKSSNILLTGSELRVKISDFGLSAQLCCTAASKRSIGGTAQYFSPERGLEQSYDFAADMWATGCIVLECVLKEHLKEALWPEHKEAVLRLKIDDATMRNPLLGMQASKLLQREAKKRISASQLFSALSSKQVSTRHTVIF